jgi:prepilin-type N-terminal cleavage/methylation domain-containing protein
MKKFKTNKSNKKYRGFSLVELLIAMFIFVITITAAISVFITIMSNRQKGRDIQKDVEDSRVALDLMAKNMRMSSGLKGQDLISGQKYKDIIMLNNSQGLCIRYKFGSNGDESYLEMGQAFPDSSGNCDFGSVSDFEKVVSGNVSGFFLVSETSDSNIGKATIVLTVDNANLETSVSFRDYDYNK